MTREYIETLEHEYFPESFTDKEKRDALHKVAIDHDTSVVILENCSYPTGLVGWVCENNKIRALYQSDKMIEDLMTENNWSYEDAVEWYDFNTYRGVPYCYTEDAPCPVIIEED